MRTKITLACTECKQRNYNTKKNKKNDPDRLEMNKYCKFCRTSQRNQVGERRAVKVADEKKPGFFKRIASGIKRFFKDTKSELKKVVWPSKKTVLNNTGIVIVVLVLSSVSIGIIDFVFNALVGLFH